MKNRAKFDCKTQLKPKTTSLTKRLASATVAAAVFFCTVCAGFLHGCARFNVYDGFAFHSPYRAEAYGNNLSDNTGKKITELLSEFEKTFSTEKGGGVAAISNARAGERVGINADLTSVLETTGFCFKLTDGKFDPTVFPLVKLWSFEPDFPVLNFSPPSEPEISEKLKTCGFEKIIVTTGNGDSGNSGGYVEKTQSETELAFGGIAKGYAADKIAEILIADGAERGYVNVGTSSLRLISVEELGVRHPDDGEKRLLTIDCKRLKNVSVSTSGDYERFYEYEGERYCHIIDPETGYPAKTGVKSVTIVCGNGAAADGLSTALCLAKHDPDFPADLQKSELAALIKRISDEPSLRGALVFAAVEINGKKQILTNADEEMFSLSDKTYAVVKI